MKYDSGMTQFHKDIIAALRLMCGNNTEITEKFSPGDSSPAPLRDYLKEKYRSTGLYSNDTGYWCTPSKGVGVYFNKPLNNDGDKNLTLSWSQTAKFIRDNWDEVFKKDTALNSEQNTKPSYKDTFLEHYPNFDVSRFDEFAESLCVACCFDDGGAACPFPGNDECKTHWESECLFEWRDKTDEYDLEAIKEFLIKQPSENEPAESASETAVAVHEKITEVQAAFDYSELDGDTAKNLRDCETAIRQETAGYFTLLGAKFKEARELLANHANGTFEKWYTAMGFKRQTVYNLIQRYDFLGSPTIGGRENTFEALPLTLSYEVSKPDAPAELVEKVLDGDITTNAEYIKLKAELDRTREECKQLDANSAAKDKEYERELKEANKRAETEKNARENIDQAMKHVMADCQKFKDKNAELEKQVKELESRPVDVAVQDNDNAELMEELEELREENARLKDDSVKSMVIRLTLDEYDKLLEKLGGDPCLGHIIKHAKIIKL